MEDKTASFFSFARRPRAADDEGDGKYVVSLRGTLERAPATAADPASVFRAETTLSAGEISGGVVIPSPSTDAYSPYAEKWKEFDKLEKLAKRRSFQWADWIWSVILPMSKLLDPHRIAKKDELWLIGLGAGLGVIGIIRARYAKERYAHWPCPRCGAEWPGTKTEKEPKCAMCGLRLHQLAP